MKMIRKMVPSAAGRWVAGGLEEALECFVGCDTGKRSRKPSSLPKARAQSILRRRVGLAVAGYHAGGIACFWSAFATFGGTKFAMLPPYLLTCLTRLELVKV